MFHASFVHSHSNIQCVCALAGVHKINNCTCVFRFWYACCALSGENMVTFTCTSCIIILLPTATCMYNMCMSVWFKIAFLQYILHLLVLFCLFCYSLECAKALLGVHNVEVNAQNKLGDTPLHNAAWKGHADIVEMLLEKGKGIGKWVWVCMCVCERERERER